MRSLSFQKFLWVLLLLSIGAALGLYAWQQQPLPPELSSPAALPFSAVIPEFQLTDSQGRPFGSPSLQGRVWIADFIFTSCAGACPLMSSHMADLQKQLPPEIHLVSVSVDPVRDTPDRLAAYAQRYQADPARWHFLTGDPARISVLVQQGFYLSVAEGTDPAEPITHSQRFVLVDGQGRIRGYYDSTDPKMLEQLRRDAGSLLK